ncbi:MAG: nitroreductase family protein [Actinobacteria bacterium]|nr:nitroreductase family protein [Actinomycetota bacterium]
MEVTIDAIRRRRSIRKYEEREVTEEQLTQVLEAARLAPSWKNQQPWRFLVIRDAAKRQAVADILEGNPARKGIAQAPVLIVVCADPALSGVENRKEYYMADIGIVMDHIMLEAADMGLGTVFVGWYDEDKMRQALGVPDQFRIVGMTPLGYPAKEPNPVPRKELDELVHWETW